MHQETLTRPVDIIYHKKHLISNNKIIIFSFLLLFFTCSEVSAVTFQDAVPVGEFPRDIALDSNLRNLYVPNYNEGTISIIDSQNMIIKDTIVLGKQAHPSQIVVDDKQNFIFVTDKITGILTIIDGKNSKIIYSKKIGESLWSVDFNQQNKKLYVSDLLQNKILVMNTKNFEIIKSISVSPNPWAVKINQLNNLVFVASGASETIHVIDGSTDSIIHDFSYGKNPWGLSINEKKNILYVTSWNSNMISVIRLDDYDTMYEISVTSGVWKIITNQNNGLTIASNEHTNELYFIDESSKHFKTITTNSAPQALTVNSVSNIVYTTNPLSNSVSSIPYKYDSKLNSEYMNDILENDKKGDIISDILTGIYEIPQREEVDYDLISNLLQNLGITGKFDGNEIASILLEDYNKKKDVQPKTVSVPKWTIDIASMFIDKSNYDIPDKINCEKDPFSFMNNTGNTNPFEIWVNILPICALS